MSEKLKCYISGVAGFLGSYIAEALLAEGHEVGGNDNLVGGDMANVPMAVKFNGTDCCDFIGMKKNFDKFKPDVVIHAAALAHEGLSSFSPSFITRSIYEASISTFSAAISSGAKRIVYMSSMARYGAQTPPFTEEMIPAPVDCYAVAKVAAEESLKILCKTHDVKWSILVPHSIIGKRQRYSDPFRNVASIMINRALKKEPLIIYGDGEQTRCFSPVEDCVPSIIKAIHGVADGEVVNIGPDKGEISIKRLADMIDDLTSNPWNPLHYADRANEVKHAFTSSEKARRLLDYKEQKSIEGSLKEMVEAIKSQGTKDFDYSFPIEIEKGCPLTWKDRLI